MNGDQAQATRGGPWGRLPVWVRCALIFVAGYVLAQAFARAPMMGDDIDYYGFALHRCYPRAEFPPSQGFHFLRWTVWGPIWAYMQCVDPGFGAFVFVPFACLAAICAMVYLLGRELFGEAGALGASLIVFFHPLMDDLMLRPMPDIVEAALATVALLVFWRRQFGRSGGGGGWIGVVGPGMAVGVLAFLSWVNRPTGIIWFIAAVVLSLLLARRLLPLFPVAIATFAVCFAIEGWIYAGLFDNFWHSWSANLEATDRKGTGPVALWWLPLRYLSVIASGGALKSILLAFSVLGGVLIWRGRGPTGRFIIGWCVLLYLGVSCGLQSVAPVKPLVRVGERFIGGLAVPLALLAMAGVSGGWRLATARWPGLSGRAGWAIGLGAMSLVLLSSRSWRDLQFMPEMKSWLKSRPPGSVVAADGDAYEAAHVASPRTARRLRWEIVNRGDLLGSPRLPGVREADHLLVCRPRLMVTLRKHLESRKLAEEIVLPRELLGPEFGWDVIGVAFQPVELDDEAEMLAAPRGARAPDFLWLRRAPDDRRRAAASISPLIRSSRWEAYDDEIGRLSVDDAGALVFHREGRGQARFIGAVHPVAPGHRGRAVQFRADISSGAAEPFEVAVAFFDARGRHLDTQLLRTYGAPWGLWDFNAIEVPRDAATFRVLVAARSACPGFSVDNVLMHVAE